MNKRFLQVISAALCVLLLAGCGAAPAKEDDTTRTAPRTQPAQTDNAPTQRGSVMPDVSCQVEWGEGVQPDQVIGDAAQAYFTLLGTALSAPFKATPAVPMRWCRRRICGDSCPPICCILMWSCGYGSTG